MAAQSPQDAPHFAAQESWSSLQPEEVQRRLQRSSWELSNRRKILLRGLPQDSSAQEVHELLKDYELKYCYVDRNKGTAFVTLLNGEQAQDAIQKFHGSFLRDKEISVHLQPTDALLCITNLPPSFTMEQFEELVRTYGNIERCFLVYNEKNGYSRGYGFVEYMKKDSAAKARQELIGKQVQEYTLFAQWMDINQLTPDLIHSKCICVDNLPKDYVDSGELMQVFSSMHQPIFCQLANEEGSSFGGFAVVEYETVEQAEMVIEATDDMIISGTRIRVSFCAPGSPGRSTLAALAAAQGMSTSLKPQNNGKGLLPEPNPMQIMKSLNNPALMQMLLQPQFRAMGGKQALGASSMLPQFLNASVNPAFLQLNKANQQKSGLGNTALLLQNFSQIQMAQQQLLKLKNTQTNNNKPGLLGEAPTALLQTALGMGQGQSMMTDMAHHGETHKAANMTPSQMQATRMGIMPFFQNQHGGGQHVSGLHQEKQSSTEEGMSGSKAYQSFPNNSTGAFMTGLNKHTNSKNNNPSAGASLLGEPPGDYRLSSNPFLNLSSVLSNASLPTRNHHAQQARMLGNAMDASVSQGSSSQSAMENYYSQQYGDYAQDAAQQWWTQYSTPDDVSQEQEYEHENKETQVYHQVSNEDYYNQVPSTAAYGDYNTYLHVMPSYYTASQGSYQPQNSMQASVHSGSQNPLQKTTMRNEKRGSSYLLPSPEPNPVAYVDQQFQGGAEYYADSYLKRKRVY